MKSIIGYWEVWHFALAIILFMWVYIGRFPFDLFWKVIGRDPFKQLTLYIVMGIALLWEIGEAFFGLGAYLDFKHFLLNSYKDLGVALIGSLICIILFKEE